MSLLEEELDPVIQWPVGLKIYFKCENSFTCGSDLVTDENTTYAHCFMRKIRPSQIFVVGVAAEE